MRKSRRRAIGSASSVICASLSAKASRTAAYSGAQVPWIGTSTLSCMLIYRLRLNRLDIPFRRALGRIGDADAAGAQPRETPHVFVTQRKIEHVDVFGDMPFF